MKIKHLFAVAALLLGNTGAFAQTYIFNDANFVYESIDATLSTSDLTGEVAISACQNPLSGAVTIQSPVTYTTGGKTWTFKVTKIETAAMQNQHSMTSLTLPVDLKEIEASALQGCSDLATLTFPEGSELRTLGTGALASTKISEFDFSKCTKLTGFPDLLFVRSNTQPNSMIKKITMPTSSNFKTIGNALAYLPELATTNLESTKITSIVAEAFKGSKKLTSLVVPNTVKTIAAQAFNGSAIATLTINVDAIQQIGDGAKGIYENNGDPAKDNETLTSLTMRGTLVNGTIRKAAFGSMSKVTTLNLSGLNFGEGAKVEANAMEFNNDAITSLTLGNFLNNTNSTPVLAAAAITVNKATSVTIGNIESSFALTTGSIVSAELASVKIGNIKSSGKAIDDAAFTFKNKVNSSVTIGSLYSINGAAILGDAPFTFGTDDGKHTATIKIGAIQTAGCFDDKLVDNAETFKSVTMTFDGAIVTNGIAVQLLNDASKLTTLNFNGAIAAGGIAAAAAAGKGMFYGMPTGATINFKGNLAGSSMNPALVNPAELAIGAGAFEQNPATNKLTVNYTATPEDDGVNPFSQLAFVDPTTAAYVTPRTVTLLITDNTLKSAIKAAQKNANDDVIYRVVLISKLELGMKVYLKNGSTTSYGRFNLVDLEADLTDGVTIPRRQNGITYTLYTTYVEDDATAEKVTINMHPMVTTDGVYRISKATLTAAKTADKDFVILIKAIGTTENETLVSWSDAFTALESNYYTDYAVKVHKGAVVTWEDMRDNNAAAPFNKMFVDDDYTKGQAKDIYFLTNPANHNGITAPTWPIIEKNVKVAEGNYYFVTPHYEGAAAARIVWLDGSEETTAIEKVQTVSEQNDVIYNLAGQKVSADYKGVVIKNGKKFMQK